MLGTRSAADREGDHPDLDHAGRDSFYGLLAARLAHGSQTSDPEELRANWRARAARIGASAGLDLAEAFTIIQLD